MRSLVSSGLKSVEASDGDAGDSPYQCGSEPSGGEVLDHDVDLSQLEKRNSKAAGKRLKRGDDQAATASQAQAAAVQDDAEDAHCYWWLSRTNRKATCNTCKSAIDGGAFSTLFIPDQSKVYDKRVWKHLFWKYHHISRECMPRDGLQPVSESNFHADIGMLPKRCGE